MHAMIIKAAAIAALFATPTLSNMSGNLEAGQQIAVEILLQLEAPGKMHTKMGQ